jgi:hypothetical protein
MIQRISTNSAAADRATNLAEQHDTDDEQDPVDGGDDGRDREQVADEDEVTPRTILGLVLFDFRSAMPDRVP